MQNDFENVPDHVFTLLRDKAYEELNFQEKQEVLSFFSEEEYRDMRSVLTAIAPDSAPARKNAVMGHFDQVHGQGRTVSLPSRSNGWLKAAAVLIPLFALAAFVLLKDMSNNRMVSQVVIHDTVYVKGAAATDTVVLHDTVYLKSQQSVERSPVNRGPAVYAGPGDLGSLDILSIGQIDAAPNAVKGNSLKEDTLWLRFEAASL